MGGVKPASSQQQGDLFAVVQLHLPAELDERSKELVQEFQQLNPANPRAELRW